MIVIIVEQSIEATIASYYYDVIAKIIQFTNSVHLIHVCCQLTLRPYEASV